ALGPGWTCGRLPGGAPKVATAARTRLLTSRAVRRPAAPAFGAGPPGTAVAAGLGATPTAAAGYTLAREMGGDAQLIAAIITATTLLSFITMPIAISLVLH